MKSRIFQLIFVILAISAIAGGFLHFRGSAATKINASKVNNLTSGLVGYWTFDGADMTATQALDKAASNNMTLNSTTKNIGKIGQSLTFNGTSDYINAAAGIINGIDTVTVSAWVKRTGAGSGDGGIYEMIFQEGLAEGVHLVSSCNGNNLLQFGFRSGGITYSTTTSNSIIADANWHQVSGVYDGDSNKIYLYVDGVEQSNSDADVDMGDVGDRIRIGGTASSGQSCDGSDSSANFKGSIDEVRVYSRALSPSEVTELYQQGQTKINASQVNKLTNGLVGHWTMDGQDINWGAAKPILDKSGNSNNGAVTGLTTASAVLGKIGQAMNFGTSKNITITDNAAIQLTSPFTYGTWFKLNSIPVGIERVLYKDGGFSIRLGTGANNLGCVDTINGSGVYATVSFATNVWYHVVCTISGAASGQQQLYINGANSGGVGDGWEGHGAVGQGLYIGSSSTPAQYFDGQIDEVRLYSRVLSQSEVTELYQQGQTKINASQDQKLTDGLVGYWSMDGNHIDWSAANAEIRDQSGNANHGDASSSGMTTANAAIGKVGQAMNFNGSSDNINTGDDASLDLTGSKTVSAWINPVGGTADSHRISSKWGAGGHGWRLIFEDTGNNCGDDLVEFSDGPGAVCSANPIALNQWTHVTGVNDVDGNFSKIYINGELSNTGTVFGSTSSSGRGHLIGSTDFPNGFFKGKIDEVRVYDRALSQSEVTELYNMGR